MDPVDDTTLSARRVAWISVTLGSMMIFPPFPSVSERAMIAIGEVFSMISLVIVMSHPRDTIVRFSGDVDVKSVSDIEILPSVTL